MQIKKMDIVHIMLMLVVLLVLTTKLNQSQGYLCMFVYLSIILLVIKGKMASRNWVSLLFFILTFILYFVFEIQKDWFSINIKNSIIMLLAMAAVYIVSNMRFFDNENVKNEYIIDILYFTIYLFIIYHLIKYAKFNIENWEVRMLSEYQIFPFGWHHVDFSMLVILTFLLGFKRGFYLLSILVGILATIIMPSRTWQLFLVLFIFFYLFKSIIYKLLKFRVFNSVGKVFLWAIFSTLILSWIWLNALPLLLEIKDSHLGIFDTSNMERFTSIFQSAVSIIKEKLIFKGMDYKAIDIGPHNSFFSILLFYSIGFGGVYLYLFSKVLDKYNSRDMIPYIYPYIFISCILHDNFIGIRFLYFVLIILIPFREKSLILYKNTKGG